MTKEIQRKLTSLTLMTIMFAGGLTFAAPSVMPSAFADHTPNLYVSAENSQFDNAFAGPQVIEVIVNDPNLRDTDESKGEPTVTVNGKKLRMVQSTEGVWYAYFASKAHAQAADTFTASSGITTQVGLNFGTFCTASAANSIINDANSFDETTGVFHPGSSCSDTSGSHLNNVVREAKTPTSAAGSVRLGQVDLTNVNYWPFIQLYDFNVGSTVEILYDGGGADQVVQLDFDTVEGYANHATDRSKYPFGSEVHLSVTDVLLNIDPTDEDSWTFGTASGTIFYQRFDENGDIQSTSTSDDVNTVRGDLMFDTNGQLLINLDTQSTGAVLVLDNNADAPSGTFAPTNSSSQYITLVETKPTSAMFVNYDENDDSNLDTNTDDIAKRETSATIDYNESPQSVRIGSHFATISIDVDTAIWSSGQEVPVTLKDQDANKNSRADEDLFVNSASTPLIPTLQTGNPFTLGNYPISITADNSVVVQPFSKRAMYTPDSTVSANTPIVITITASPSTIAGYIPQPLHGDTNYTANNPLENGFRGLNLLNLDVSSIFGSNTVTVAIGNATIGTDVGSKSLSAISYTDSDLVRLGTFTGATTAITITGNYPEALTIGQTYPIVLDLFSFGITDDGQEASERNANQIIRIEVEETGDNTATFTGSLEYTMINQLNVLDNGTYTGLSTIADDPSFIVFEDLTDEDSPRVNYNDLGADGVVTPIGVQQEAPSHSGVVSFDATTYKVADTVTITLNDQDLNVDSDLTEIYTIVTSPISDDAIETVGKAGLPTFDSGALGRLLDITFNDQIWAAQNIPIGGLNCSSFTTFNDGFASTGFTLAETESASGIFKGDFQVPDTYCERIPLGTSGMSSVTGTDIEVNYVDYRDAAGEIIEVGAGAGIRANTGSVSLDRTVYPVPFGQLADFVNNGNQPRSIFSLHSSATGDQSLPEGKLQVHLRVTDPDYDISASGSDRIATDIISSRGEQLNRGPIKITVSRGGDSVILGYAGGSTANDGVIYVSGGSNFTLVNPQIRDFGPIDEISPDSGIFELDFEILYTDGPANSNCPVTTSYASINGSTGVSSDYRFGIFDSTTNDKTFTSSSQYCILQGDIITVEYTDTTDASGKVNTVTDSATFDLRNGVLQTDQTEYIIGGDMILTLIDPDLNLDSDAAETLDLDLINWDSDAADISMGNLGGNAAAFDPEPSDLRETGDNTGIFQIVIEIPRELSNEKLERGEAIDLEYTDHGPSGADHVGDEDEDIQLTISTSNYGATIELDQKVYTWTDKIFVTIIAPDHNFDSNLIDEIGDGVDDDPLRISTRSNSLVNYKLVETDTDSGIFSGEVILTGFNYDADGIAGFDTTPTTSGTGPTDGFLQSSDDDGITVSYEYTEDSTVVGTALIRWNQAELNWVEASYSASASGIIRLIDPDMNLNPESVDNFDIDIWSDSDVGGIDLTVTETNEATGIFEGTVFFTVTDESSGHRLRVSEGDTVTARYQDRTLPEPYTTGDDLDVYSSTLIGTIVPALERVSVSNLATVDALKNELDSVSVDQQVQIQASLVNNQERSQQLAYLVQIQDANGVTVSLSWFSGTLSAGQSSSYAQSWIPTSAGSYTAQVFVWEGVDNPTALAPSSELTITVS